MHPAARHRQLQTHNSYQARGSVGREFDVGGPLAVRTLPIPLDNVWAACCA